MITDFFVAWFFFWIIFFFVTGIWYAKKGFYEKATNAIILEIIAFMLLLGTTYIQTHP